MSKVIVVLNPKGGAGKTTTAVSISNCLSTIGDVQLKDADPQASATSWIEIAEESGELPFHFEITNKSQMARNSEKYDFTIIDTPPQDSSIIDAAVKVADFIIIPTAPSGLDLERVYGIIEVLDSNNYAVLFTQANHRTNTYKFARAALEDEKIKTFKIFIPFRESIKSSFGKLDSCEHYGAFTHELLDRLKEGEEE